MNKAELFPLSRAVLAEFEGTPHTVVYTINDSVVSSSASMKTNCISPCDHEDADEHLILHVRYQVQNGHVQLHIVTNDTDVLVIAIAKWFDFRQQ